MRFGNRGPWKAPGIRPVQDFWRERVRPKLRPFLQDIHRAFQRRSVRYLAAGLACAVALLLLVLALWLGGLFPGSPSPGPDEEGTPDPSLPQAVLEGPVTREQADRL